MDLTKLQMQRDYLVSAGETVAGEVVEVVATQVQELGVGGEATGDFGVTTALTCGMLCFNLGRRKSGTDGTLVCNGRQKTLYSIGSYF